MTGDECNVVCTLLNVHGSIDRCMAGLEFPRSSNVYIFTETWMSSAIASEYVFPVTGYTHLYSCRQHSNLHGGVSVLVRNDIQVECVATHVDPEVVALSFGARELLLIACYASPRHAANQNVDIFEELSLILARAPRHKEVLLLGDFNARVGLSFRSTEPIDLQNPFGILRFVDDEAPLPIQQHPRRSMDTARPTRRGRDCINFCEQHTFEILNGACMGDLEGVLTYKTPDRRSGSVVDLGMVSHGLFDRVSFFEVSDTGHISDHQLIQVGLQIGDVLKAPRGRFTVPKRMRWNSVNWPQYAACVESALPDLSVLFLNMDSATISEVDGMAARFIKQVCKLTFRAFPRHHRRGAERVGTVYFEWWDDECQVVRSIMRREHRRCKSMGIASDESLRAATTAFKSLVKRKRREARMKAEQKLITDLSRDPLAFWRKWGGNSKGCAIDDCELFVEHFKKVFINDTPGLIQEDTAMAEEDPVVGLGLDTRLGIHNHGAALGALNAPFQYDELVQVLKNMKNGKATSDGFKVEVFKYAKVKENSEQPYVHVLVDDLLTLFNKIFLGEMGLPSTWHEVVVVPVYKGKGREDDPDNYRGISLLTTYYKIYASLLEQRLTTFCDALEVRASTQVGFRKHHGTTTALFTVRHALHATCSPLSQGGQARPLLVCFIDFKKAFDSVVRELIWKRLSQIGVVGPIYTAILALYADTKFRVKVNGKTSRGYIVTVSGVKQGCPISPLLFGLFIDQLHEYLKEQCPQIGVCVVAEEHLKDILYADDVGILAHSVLELQQLCDTLASWCEGNKMEVNIAKTEIVCFRLGAGHVHDPVVMLSGQALKVSDSFKYLGLPLHATRGFADVCLYTADKARKALWALLSRIEALRITNLKTQLKLFQTLVESIGNYGCQVWGVDYFRVDTESHILSNPVQKVVLTFLRMISGAHNTTSRWVLLREFGLYPCQLHWVCLCTRFWNRLTSDPCIPIGRGTLEADVELFRKKNTACWTTKFLKLMHSLNLLGDRPWSTLQDLPCSTIMSFRFSENVVRERMIERYNSIWHTRGMDPRTAPRLQYQVTRHGMWFDAGHTRHLALVAPEHYIKTLMRFRLGCTMLQVHQDHGTLQRHNRFCRVCSCDLVEDEKHVLFECEAYSRYRRSECWSSLFDHSEGDVKTFMGQEDQYKIAHFLVVILRYRAHLLVRLGEQVSRLVAQNVDANRRLYLDAFDSTDDD